MKLYTEEQVRQMLWELGDVLFNNCQNGIKEGEPEIYFDDIFEDKTPIELPTDEEIGKGCDENIPLDEEDMWSERLYFRIGAKWYREQLKKKQS